MELQYASDLHIDDFPSVSYDATLTPVAPVLLLAGDLCSVWKPAYAAFLRWCSQRWRLVVVIAGNHEYFCEPGASKTMDEADDEARRVAASLGNVVFLQGGDSLQIPGTNLRVVGATLWSAVAPSIHHEILEKGDYACTYTATPTGIRKTTPMDICALHALQKAQLQSALASHPKDRLILMTHHLPTLSLVAPRFAGHRRSSCFASADDDLFLHENLALVVCGHSHQSVQRRLSTGVLAVMNARGYATEQGTTGYSSRASIRLPTA